MVGFMIPSVGRLPRPLWRFDRDMDQLMERFFGPEEGLWDTSELLLPTMNVVESTEGYEVTLELPGVKPENFNVELKEGELWISGEKKQEEEEHGKTYRRIERRYGQFRRVIPLPGSVDEGKIEAHYSDGVLRVVVPKTEEAKPKHIEVKA